MQDNTSLRMLLAVIFILLALFCLYGLVGSFEPGNSMFWRVGYGLGTLTFFSLGIRFGKGS